MVECHRHHRWCQVVAVLVTLLWLVSIVQNDNDPLVFSRAPQLSTLTHNAFNSNAETELHPPNKEPDHTSLLFEMNQSPRICASLGVVLMRTTPTPGGDAVVILQFASDEDLVKKQARWIQTVCQYSKRHNYIHVLIVGDVGLKAKMAPKEDPFVDQWLKDENPKWVNWPKNDSVLHTQKYAVRVPGMQARLFALWELTGPNGDGVSTIMYMDVDFIIVEQERDVQSIINQANTLPKGLQYQQHDQQQQPQQQQQHHHQQQQQQQQQSPGADNSLAIPSIPSPPSPPITTSTSKSNCIFVAQDAPHSVNSGWLLLQRSLLSRTLMRDWIRALVKVGPSINAGWNNDQGPMQHALLLFAARALNTTAVDCIECNSDPAPKWSPPGCKMGAHQRNLCWQQAFQAIGRESGNRSVRDVNGDAICLFDFTKQEQRYNMRDGNQNRSAALLSEYHPGVRHYVKGDWGCHGRGTAFCPEAMISKLSQPRNSSNTTRIDLVK